MSVMLKPGNHHFFFIKGGKWFFLTKDFPVEHYKETNVRMNMIYVPANEDWQIPEGDERIIEWGDQDESSDDGKGFKIKDSVFKGSNHDDPRILSRMFNADWELTKIPKALKDPNDIPSVKDLLRRKYKTIKNFFLMMATESNFPNVGFNGYSEWY